MSEEAQTGVEEISNLDTSAGEADQQSGETTTEPVVEGVEGTQEGVEKPTQKVKEEKVVPLAALEAERRKRQDYERETARERGAREALERQINELRQPKVEQQPQFDPEEPITVKQAQEMLAQYQERNRVQAQQERIAKSADDTRAKYKEADFTYDDALVWASGYDNLGNRVGEPHLSPGALGAVLTDPNPAQTLYDLVLLKNTDLRKKQDQNIQTETVKKTAEVINRHLNQPSTLTNVGGSNRVLDQVKKWETMTNEEFEAEVQKTLNQRAG